MRIPLSSLMAFRGPEYLPHSRNPTSKLTSRSPEPSSSQAMISEDLKEATENVLDKDKRSTRGFKKSLPAASSPSLRTLGQDRLPQRMSSYIPSPTTFNTKSKSLLPLTSEDRERDNERLLERQKSREKLEREAQYPKKWEEHLGFSINLGAKDKSKNKDRAISKSLNEDRNNFFPTSREEAEQAGMKVICINFRVQSSAAGEWDKSVAQYPKARKYTSTGPSLALIAGGTKGKTKTNTGPQVVIDPGVYIGESSLESSSRPTASTPVTDSVNTHPTGFSWNFFGGKVEDKERKTSEKRKPAYDDHGSLPPPSAAAEDLEAHTAVKGWKYGNRSAEFGGEVNEAGYAVIIPERSDSISPSLPKKARPTVIVPSLPLATTSTATTAATSPNSLDQANDNSDSSSSVSVSSPVFAHSANESDLDDDSFMHRGGATNALSGVSGKPWKGYRHGGYSQVQKKKAKNEHLVTGDKRGVAKAPEVEVNTRWGGAGQPQQTRRDGKERNRDEENETWIALDMVNDNGSCRFFHSFIYIYIHGFF